MRAARAGTPGFCPMCGSRWFACDRCGYAVPIASLVVASERRTTHYGQCPQCLARIENVCRAQLVLAEDSIVTKGS